MNIENINPKNRLVTMRETIIYNQLKKILPRNIKKIDILLCAHRFRVQHDKCAVDPDYKKN